MQPFVYKKVLSCISSNSHNFLLGCIFILALLIRLIYLGSFPTNFHEDEVLVGYVGRFILENGADLYGNPWPLWYFDKFGDFYIIGPFYLSGLATLLFGVNEFAVRFPSAFIGALGTIPMYYLVNQLFKNKRTAIFSAFLLAIFPWHVVLSRSSSEGVLGATFCLTALYFFLKGIEKDSILTLIMGTLICLFSYWLYHPYRTYAPAFLLVTIVFFWTYIKQIKTKIFLITTLMLFSLFTLWIMSTPWGQGRLQQTSIFGEISGVSIRNQILIYDTGNNSPILARLLHNKPLGYGREFLRQYFSYFAPKYLFLDSWGEKFIVPEQGMMFISYLFFLLAFIWYFGYLIKNDSARRILLYYLILAALSLIPPAMTYIGSPNINRSMMFGVLLIPAIAYGATLLMNKHKLIFLIIALFLVFEITYFGLSYKLHFDSANSISRQDAVKPLIHFIEKYHDKDVYLPQDSTMAIYYLFFNHRFDPELMGRFKSEVRIPQIDNVHFIPESQCMNTEEEIIQSGIQEKNIIAFKYTCGERPLTDTRFKLISFVKQTGELLGYRVYEYMGIGTVENDQDTL
ncbi:MAG TPA: glycosyltransferase family 39 protein [Candidatus Woesebacteria bacterium]|nr:glycosyltransferase family 39 protein [Candidatus Woesebacteria bacterium]HNS94559.1 glycosyltransferase family 39 protein [Candidatus Woesebacteria bacterium]